MLLTLVEEERGMTTEGHMIPARYTHRQLASMIGANREATTRAFRELREAGAVELRGRRVRRGARGVRPPAYFGSFLSPFRSPAFVGTGSG
jgi:DNA-binding transcriptional MocR family regulator